MPVELTIRSGYGNIAVRAIRDCETAHVVGAAVARLRGQARHCRGTRPSLNDANDACSPRSRLR